MTDVHDKATRSKNMRAIGTRDTAIEKRLAGLLTLAGFDFRVQDPALAGRPDFVIDAWQCIIFTRVSVHYLYPRLFLASSRLLPV